MDTFKATRHLIKVDPDLAKVVRNIGSCTLKPDKSRTVYASLVRSIVYQQLTGKVAGIILNRLLDLFPGKRFPSPKSILSISIDRLRGAGLSNQKAQYIRNIAQASIDGIVPDSRKANRMTDQQLINQLTSIKGVGRWTVEMLLIFRLGRPDVLPATDYGVQKGFAIVKCLDKHPKPKQLIVAGECWSPYRTVATWYLWRATDTFG
ncbi:MAG: DNA-3-methyladenine glycosylase [Verrucomicrobiota bacterium]|nr:DNA-3-methyladenine glycosylase [Verrucomicrobiota bacterium]